MQQAAHPGSRPRSGVHLRPNSLRRRSIERGGGWAGGAWLCSAPVLSSRCNCFGGKGCPPGLGSRAWRPWAGSHCTRADGAHASKAGCKRSPRPAQRAARRSSVPRHPPGRTGAPTSQERCPGRSSPCNSASAAIRVSKQALGPARLRLCPSGAWHPPSPPSPVMNLPSIPAHDDGPSPRTPCSSSPGL